MQYPDSISLPPEAGSEPPAAPEDPSWDLLDIILTIIFAYICLNVLALMAVGVAQAIPRFRHLKLDEIISNALVSIPVQLLAYLFIVGFMVVVVRVRHEVDLLARIGWNAPGLQVAGIALVGGLGLAMCSQILAALLSRWTPASLPMERFFQKPTSAYVVSFFGVFVAPVFEELFFRGFLYPVLARRTGVMGGIWITAIAFAMLHGMQLGYSWAALVPILFVGLVLTTIRAVSKSVALSVLVHTAYNATILGITLIVTHGFTQVPHP